MRRVPASRVAPGELRASSVAGKLEAAVVEAEDERGVVGEIAVVDEARGQPLGLNRVVRPQLRGDLLQVGLLGLQVAKPLAQLGRVGGWAGDGGDPLQGRAEDRGRLSELAGGKGQAFGLDV